MKNDDRKDVSKEIVKSVKEMKKEMKGIVEQALEEIQLEEQVQRNQAMNANLDNSIVRMIGDRGTLVQIIKLLAFIRNAINTHEQKEIKLKINTKVADGKFMFDVNQQEVQDLIVQDEVEID